MLFYELLQCEEEGNPAYETYSVPGNTTLVIYPASLIMPAGAVSIGGGVGTICYKMYYTSIFLNKMTDPWFLVTCGSFDPFCNSIQQEHLVHWNSNIKMQMRATVVL